MQAQAVETLRGYYAHMAALDDCLGRLLAALDRSGATEDTVVIFTSDHGDMALSQGLTTKLYPWEESIRVPFLVRYPHLFARLPRLFAAEPTGLPVRSPEEAQTGRFPA